MSATSLLKVHVGIEPKLLLSEAGRRMALATAEALVRLPARRGGGAAPPGNDDDGSGRRRSGRANVSVQYRGITTRRHYEVKITLEAQ